MLPSAAPSGYFNESNKEFHAVLLVRESVFPGSSALDLQATAAQSPADFLLGCISASTCTSYLSYISSIPRFEVLALHIYQIYDLFSA